MDLAPFFEPMGAVVEEVPSLDDVELTASENSFLDMLAADDDNMEDFGLSLLENNHDIIDFMAPLMEAPFSRLPCDEYEVGIVGSHFSEQQLAIQDSNSVFDETSQLQDAMSPLRQLLLTKTSKRSSNVGLQTNSSSVQTGRKRSTRTKSAQSQTKHQVTNTTSTKSRSKSSSTHSRKYHHSMPVDEVILDPKEKQISKALKFPPCSVCGGKASGLHYGVNSCEACKGFFRRYIIRNEEYKCAKDGNCKVVNKNRENCSGCRLKRCLDLGMSKENSKLGRYSLTRRTETIKKVNVLEGKEKHDRTKAAIKRSLDLNHFRFDHTYSGMASEKQSPRLDDIIKVDECSPDSLIEQLVNAMDAIQPYGPNITTREQINDTMERHHTRYQSKVAMYGEMKAVSSEEYYKLLKDFGIDIDGRIKVFKEYVLKIKRISEKYCNFAQHIPGFKNLDASDQSKLLNASRTDFFVALMHEGFNEEYQILLARSGVPYHVDELADKFFSRNMFAHLTKAYLQFQKLEMNKEEKALLVALILVFTDRCKLENQAYVDKMQYLVSELLRYQLERSVGVAMAARRFAKFVDGLIYLRDLSDVYWREYGQLIKDELIAEQVPMATEFYPDDW